MSKPQFCGGAWRNGVYDMTNTDQMDDLIIDRSIQFREEGCYIDDEHRDLKGDVIHMGGDASQQACATLCAAGGFEHFGLQYAHECFCGNTFGNRGGAAPPAECGMACSGNAAQMCGDSWRNNVFTITNTGGQLDLNTEIDVSYIRRGCYIDSGDEGGRDMGPGIGNDVGTVTNMAVQASAHTCAELCYGYEHFGLQYHSQCFCDNNFGTHGQDTAVPSGCNTPCNHADLKARLGALVDQVDADGNIVTAGVMPSCEGSWTPECDTAAAALDPPVRKPEICGGAWRNSVYDVTTHAQMDEMEPDSTILYEAATPAASGGTGANAESNCYIDGKALPLCCDSTAFLV